MDKTLDHQNNSPKKSHVGEAATDLLNEGKKYANELYDQGLNKVGEAEDSVKEYSDELVKKVHENPLTALAIAAGIGFLLSTLLRK
jgi:ElaB/YqjD/DUF883 family membrane-anchored ribosome-binding protein